MSSYIEEALIKARALAKQAKARPATAANGNGLAAAGEARAMAGPQAPSTIATTRTTPGVGGGAAPHMRAQAEGRRLFIGGLSYDTTDQSLEAYLSTKWPTEEAKVKRDTEGKSRGFAFVTFPVISILEDCFAAQPHWIDGKQVELRKVSPDGSSGNTGGTKRPAGSGVTHYGGGGGGNSTRVFIGQAPGGRSRGLNDEVGDEDLRTYFERYGTVTGIAQHRWEDTGRKKGFGYMEFAEYEAAQAALGIHVVVGVQLEVKPYTQGGARTVTAPPPGAPAPPPPPTPSYNASGVSSDYGYGSGGAGYGYGYGTDNKRARTDLPTQGGAPDNNAAMMEQMKSMMVQMQQMQQQLSGGSGTMQDQMQQMQQTMYSMMQTQYMQSLGGGSGSTTNGSSTSYPGSSSSYPGSSSSYPGSSTSYPGYPSSTSSSSHPPAPPTPYQYPSTIEYPKPPGTNHY